MKLLAPDGSSFELTVVGYQFLNITDDEYDSNWLRIAIEVAIPHGSWKSIDASLLTWEVESLSGWLRSITKDTPCGEQSTFIEPNLSFVIAENEHGNKVVRIFFELECRPSWAPAEGAPMSDLWADFPLEDLRQLRDAAADLMVQLANYPKRAMEA